MIDILRTAILELAELGRVTDETHSALVEAVAPNDTTDLRFADVEDRLKKLEKPTSSSTSAKGKS